VHAAFGVGHSTVRLVEAKHRVKRSDALHNLYAYIKKQLVAHSLLIHHNPDQYAFKTTCRPTLFPAISLHLTPSHANSMSVKVTDTSAFQ